MQGYREHPCWFVLFASVSCRFFQVTRAVLAYDSVQQCNGTFIGCLVVSPVLQVSDVCDIAANTSVCRLSKQHLEGYNQHLQITCCGLGWDIVVTDSELTGFASIVLTGDTVTVNGTTHLQGQQVSVCGNTTVIDDSAHTEGVESMTVFGGSMTLTGNASINSNSLVHIGSSVSRLTDYSECSSNLTLGGTGVVINGGQVILECMENWVVITDRAHITSQSFIVTANGADLYGNAIIIAAELVDVTTQGPADEVGAVLGAEFPGLNSVHTNLQVVANGGVRFCGANWTLRSLSAFGGSIVVEQGMSIQTVSSRQPDTRIIRIGQGFSEVEDHCISAQQTVTFEFALWSRDQLRFEKGVKVSSASILICVHTRGAVGTFEEGVVLDVSGRGSALSDKPSGGTGMSASPPDSCGGGGGSCFGRGGSGASLDVSNMHRAIACTNRSQLCAQNFSGLYTPSGACGAASCGNMPAGAGSGGGTIWLSGQSFAFKSGTKFLADGHAGANVPDGNGTVSGAGAGGQVILLTDFLELAEGGAVMSAKGGDAACGNTPTGTFIGGAGGGGLVGVQAFSQETKRPQTQHTEEFRVTVKGGSVSEVCARIHGLSCSSGYGKNAPMCGENGTAGSLSGCSPGQGGIFCADCVQGRWSNGSNGSSGEITDGTCPNMCQNKPSKALYDRNGSKGSECHFTCTDKFPISLVNPKCVALVTFVYFKMGGAVVLVSLLALVIAATIFLIWRFTSTGTMKRDRHLLVASCHHKDPTVPFPKDRMQFHICRVFLHGSNCLDSPWSLSSRLPTVLLPLVVGQPWDQLTQEAETITKVSKAEATFEMALGVSCPPAAVAFSSWRRFRRAKRLRKRVRWYSEGVSGRPTIWRPIRGRAQNGRVGTSSGDLTVVLGCDPGATLGYLDFFDNSPEFVQALSTKEVRVFVAHGTGSRVEPLEIDVRDPLLTHFTHNPRDAAALYGIVAGFNSQARALQSKDLSSGDTLGCGVSRVRDEVRRLVDRCSFDSNYALDVTLMPSLKSAAAQALARRYGLPKALPPVESTQHSFLDLLVDEQEHQMTPSTYSAYGTSANSTYVHSMRAGGANPRPLLMPARSVEYRLCLSLTIGGRPADAGLPPTAEAGLSAVSSVRSSQHPMTSLQGATPGHPPKVPLCTPVSQKGFSEHLSWAPVGVRHEAATRRRRGGCPRRCQAGVIAGANNALHCLVSMFARRGPGGFGGPPVLVIVALVAVFTGDAMFSVVKGILLWNLDPTYRPFAFIAWLLLPPLTLPLCFAVGLRFLFTEDPWFGRLFASLCLYNLTSVFICVVIFFTVAGDSKVFCILGGLLSGALKVTVYTCAQAHVQNIEAKRDLAYARLPEGDARHSHAENLSVSCNNSSISRPDPSVQPNARGSDYASPF